MNARTKREVDSVKPYQELLDRISKRYVEGQAQAVRSVNETMVKTNWQIGQFYLTYPICETLSHKLSWSHYCELVKISDVKHDDIGQMNMYMGYFAKEENIEGENPPI
ncbi:hypothetical protein AGMMS49525_15860 [Bacteroidia bacterium]|nr:hypothetical protein AGMMS49525_15860 [Bacteroidia bacterium]